MHAEIMNGKGFQMYSALLESIYVLLYMYKLYM